MSYFALTFTMKLSKIIFALFTIIISIQLNAESLKKKLDKKTEPPFDYNAELEKVDSLLNVVNQPKFANDLVEKIQSRAAKDNQKGYYIKCIKYRYEINNLLIEEDDTLNLNWMLINSEIAKGSNDIKAFLSMDAATLLKNIYINYRWEDERIPNDKSPNPYEWSIEKLNTNIQQYIDNAIRYSQNIAYDKIYEPIIANFTNTDFKLSIHQTIIRSAIETLSDLEIDYNGTYKSPSAKKALAPGDIFLIGNFSGEQDPKNEYKRLRLYQAFLSGIKSETDAYIYFEIQRLNELHYRYSQEDTLYITALEFLLKEYISKAYSNLVAEQIALYYQNTDPIKAIDIIGSAIARYPKFINERKLLDIKANIEKLEISLQIEKLNAPSKKILARVDYKNLDKLFVKAYPINYIDYLEKTQYRYNYDYLSTYEYLDSINLSIPSQLIKLPKFKDYNTHSAEIAIDSLSNGTYILVACSTDTLNNKVSPATFGIISIAPYTNIQDGNKLLLINAINGEPYANEFYQVYEDEYNSNNPQRYKRIHTGKTDAKGRIDMSTVPNKDRSINTLIEIGKHQLYTNYSNYSNTYYNAETNDIAYKIITDRIIYRPGQTVYVKCIAYDNKAKKTIENAKANIVFKDNNNEEKKRLNLSTNTFGSCSGEYILPKGGFNSGDFYIYVNEKYATSIKVEEYKRPKYKAVFLTPKTAYQLNDSISLTGEAKAFAGYAVHGAKVEYNVVRKLRPRYDYWWRGESGHEMNIDNGQTETDKNGQFIVNFKALADETENKTNNPYFIFEVNATITDINGEVKTCQYTMTLAYTDRQFEISNSNDNWLGSIIHFKINPTNLQDQALPFTGAIKIEKIIEPNEVMHNRTWDETDTIAISQSDFKIWFPNRTYHTKENTTFVLTRELVNETKNNFVLLPNDIKEAGTYRAIMSGKDGRGEIITTEISFKVMPKKAGKYLLPDAITIACLNGVVFEPKTKAKIMVGSGCKNTRIMVSVKSYRGTIIEKEILLNKSSQIIEIPVTAADRGNIEISAYTVYNYQLYTENITLNVPYTNKELSLSLSSFRDDIEPGSKEKWIVKLKGPASEKAAMESVAGMYDQSLDDLWEPNSWNFSVFDNYYQYFRINGSFEILQFNPLYNMEGDNYSSNYSFDFPEYNYNANSIYNSRIYSWSFGDGNGVSSNNRLYSYTSNIGYKSDEKLVLHPGSYGAIEAPSTSLYIDPSSEPATSTVTPTVIRKNFNETAFFYPHLKANAKGEIILEFTMPEALTQWKMRMFSHSTTMQTGYLEHSITTSKKVMVQPNIPRFLRQGDAINIGSKIINTTAQAINAKVNFTVTDESTGEALNWVKSFNEKTIVVPANSNAPVNFSIHIPDYTGVVSITITVNSGYFSDGEQHSLPVLSNRTLITETMPLTIREAGIQNVEFTALKNNKSTTLVHEKMSVEISSNPAWYAIQALPYMMEFPHECAEQTFTRLYANAVASHLANSNPEIKKVYAAWERAASDGNGLQSKLILNPDLKNTLIEETPWLAEAKNESERMRRLGALFNSEKMNEELQTAYEKLKQMQFENGGFGWFKGMQENNYITQTIVIGFGKMQKMGIDISRYQEMIDKAISYLDREAERDYMFYIYPKNSIKIYPPNLSYLYCKSFFPQKGLNPKDSIVQFYLINSKSTWVNNSLMGRAQLASAIKVLDPSSEIPALVLKSFNETAKQNNLMGMYWPSNKGGYYWYDATVETQAAIIEFYSHFGNEQNTIKEQQIWLLRQKQTQNWKTTRATADACYALIMNGNFLNSKQMVSVSINNIVIKPENTEEGTGYYRENIAKENITANSSNVQLNARSSDFAYGAIYWQYFEQLDKIQNPVTEGDAFTVTKTIYKIVNTANGQQKIEVKDGNLQVGDLVEISLSIRSNRNMEFVHIKDLRGSGTEPIDVLSEYHWMNNLGYYQSTKDASTSFFIDYLPKGIFQLNYTLKVEQSGVYNAGIATAECMYAPEYSANSGVAVTLNVKE